MKPFNAVAEFKHEREIDLMRAFNEQVCLHLERGHVRFSEIFKAVSKMPSRRFWVSAERASVVVSAMLRGECPKMRPAKRAMFDEICRRVVMLQSQRNGVPFLHIVEEVVEQRAPSFYLTPESIRKYIFNAKRRKKKCLSERKSALRHML